MLQRMKRIPIIIQHVNHDNSFKNYHRRVLKLGNLSPHLFETSKTLPRSIDKSSPLVVPSFFPPLFSRVGSSLSRGRDRFNNARKDAIARRVHTPSVCCHIDWLARYYVMSLTRRLHMRLARPAPLCPLCEPTFPPHPLFSPSHLAVSRSLLHASLRHP